MRSRRRTLSPTVQHEAFIEVDEAGTEAHAATGAPMAISHGFGIELNRLFFFVIRDRITGAILFLGRVADRAASCAAPTSVVELSKSGPSADVKSESALGARRRR